MPKDGEDVLASIDDLRFQMSEMKAMLSCALEQKSKSDRMSTPPKIAKQRSNHDGLAQLNDAPAERISVMDPELRHLLARDAVFDRLLQRLDLARSKTSSGQTWFQALHPDGVAFALWHVFFIVVLSVACITEPLKIAFHEAFEEQLCAVVLLVFLDVIILLALALTFFIGYREYGRVELDLSKIAGRYLTSWFLLDVVAAIPCELVVLWYHNIHEVIFLNKLLLIVRLIREKDRVMQSKYMQRIARKLSTHHLSYARLTGLMICVFLVWHYMGCLWWFLCNETGLSVADRLLVVHGNEDGRHSESSRSNFMLYLSAVYWATEVTCNFNAAVGPGDDVVRLCYEIFVIFIGLCLQAVIVGAAAAEVATMQSVTLERRRKLHAIRVQLVALGLPKFLHQQIEDYYTMVINMTPSCEGELADMPSSLKLQVAILTNESFLRNAPFFKLLQPRAIAMLVQCLKTSVFLPRDAILCQGEMTHCLYFVKEGAVEVVLTNKFPNRRRPAARSSTQSRFPKLPRRWSRDLTEEYDRLEIVISTLKPGACFGEQSFMTKRPAYATVRSSGYSQVATLQRHDFDLVCQTFPALRSRVEEMSLEMLGSYSHVDPPERIRRVGKHGHSGWVMATNNQKTGGESSTSSNSSTSGHRRAMLVQTSMSSPKPPATDRLSV